MLRKDKLAFQVQCVNDKTCYIFKCYVNYSYVFDQNTGLEEKVMTMHPEGDMHMCTLLNYNSEVL